MTKANRRPRALSVIGYSAVAIGLLLLSSGVGAQFDGDPDFLVFGAVEVAIASLVIAGAWALLRLRTWGALVLEAVAILFLLGLTSFITLFTWDTLRLSLPNGAQVVAGAIIVLLVYALPVAWAVRSLRRARLRGLLN